MVQEDGVASGLDLEWEEVWAVDVVDRVTVVDVEVDQTETGKVVVTEENVLIKQTN